MQAQTPGGARRPGLADSARFLKSLVATPRLTGAVAPSGRALARAMAAATGSPSHGLVVELGPGTGPVTQSLIEAGVAPERLVLVEYDAAFCRMLEQTLRATSASSRATPTTCRARSRPSRASRSPPWSPACRCSTSRRLAGRN